MLVVPDPTTAFLDPFTTAPTLVLVCNVRGGTAPRAPLAGLGKKSSDAQW